MTDTYVLDIQNLKDALHVLMFVLAMDAEKVFEKLMSLLRNEGRQRWQEQSVLETRVSKKFEKRVFSGRQDQFDQRVVGAGRQCDVNYASASFWKDHKYGHAELLLFESLQGRGDLFEGLGSYGKKKSTEDCREAILSLFKLC